LANELRLFYSRVRRELGGNLNATLVFIAKHRGAQGAIETPDIVLQALFIAIGIIASYNVIHAIFTILISAAIYGIVRRYIKV